MGRVSGMVRLLVHDAWLAVAVGVRLRVELVHQAGLRVRGVAGVGALHAVDEVSLLRLESV